MQTTRDHDTAHGRVPCPASFERVDPSNIPLSCPTCGGYVSVEPDPFGILSIYPHSTGHPRTVAVYRLAVKLREISVGRPPLCPDPDIDDIARAAELLAALAETPGLLHTLDRVTRKVTDHLPWCTDRDACIGECLAGTDVF